MHGDDCGCPPFEDTIAHIHGWVERGRWSLMYVSSHGSGVPWSYTIGLLDNFAHPELVIVGLSIDSSAIFLNAVAEHVASGVRLSPDDVVIADDGVELRIGAVHATHWRTDRFAMWVNYHAVVGLPASPPSALQVVWPDPEGRFPGDPGFALARFARSLARPVPVRHRPRAVPRR